MTSKSKKTICLLKGGWSSEREISLESAKGVLQALTALGYEVHEYDLTRDLSALVSFVSSCKPDVVFLNALHGVGVEDGLIQSVMEIMKLPYTGSNVAASAIGFDKHLTRQALSHHHLPIANGATIPLSLMREAGAFSRLEVKYGLPFVMKPLAEGSSIGVSIIQSEFDLTSALDQWHYGDRVLVESYIKGRELSIAMMGDEALEILELRPKSGFYDFDSKYTDGLTDHIFPVDIPDAEKQLLLKTASDAVNAMGVTGVSRVDFRYDDSLPLGQRHFILELNTLPGMTALSIVPEIAGYKGITYEKLCEWIVESAICPH